MWFSLIALLGVAEAGLDEGAYGRAIDLVGGLYLYPGEVDAPRMLHEAATSLSEELHWLMVEPEGGAVNLRRGDGALIGSVSVASLQTLPAALLSVEQLVLGAGVPVGEVDVRLELMKGMTRALDRYTRVLDGDGLDRFDVRLKGTLVGVGVTLSILDNRLTITRVNPLGPADQAGVRDGDEVVRIDGRSTVNMPTREATRLIRGEPGTPVSFTVLRGGAEVELRLTRAEIVVPNVESRVLDGGVGLVAITHVSQRTVENLLAELDVLKAKGALDRGLIVDLRGNTGGSMKESANAADEFVDAGLLLRTVGPDGARVKNLQAQMDAQLGGAVPPVPVAVLIDERTASGAEILAGALLELNRGALVGTRSYGKGTVQKIYPLDDDTRLKLTVAQYLLANDRRIANEGLVPDAVVGEIALDRLGMHYRGWDTEHLRTPHDRIIPWVRESRSWRDHDADSPHVVEELARRAVLDAEGPGREALVAALDRHAAAMKLEQEAHLVEALAARGIDWSAAEGPSATAPSVRVALRQEPHADNPDEIRLIVEVENRGRMALHRALVELSSEFSVWSGLVLPVGRIDPGATVSGEAIVALRPGINPREDTVALELRADGRPTVPAGEAVLRAQSSARPRVSATVRLAGDADARFAVVDLKNETDVPIPGIEVHFGYPGDLDVELVDQAARAPELAPRATHTFRLAVRPGPTAPAELPLQLVVEAPRYDALATWPLSLPLSGEPVSLAAPRVRAPSHPLRAPAGSLALPLVVSDDGPLEHVVVYRNGKKVAWAAGGSSRVELAPVLELDPGQNRVLVVTRDAGGIEEREQFVVRGLPIDAAVDAPDAPE